LFLSVKVKPAADLSRLEEVLVVTEKQEREAVAESGTSVRAADILARRLPSVPDKPVAAPSGGSGVKPQANGAGKAATVPVTRLAGKAAVTSVAAGGADDAASANSGVTVGVAPDSANSPAKPATLRPKPAAPQTAPPPAATEDNSH
jgi:hypothetical protein